MLFSEWLRNQTTRTDSVGETAAAWNMVPSEQRKGRVNAARLVRVAGVTPEAAERTIAEFQAL